MRIDVPEGYTGDYSDAVLEDTDELQLDFIRGRGNITWIADKKAYKFKLSKKAELLGMGKNKHWALLANRYDYSMIRNRLVSYMGERLGMAYTPKMLPVDLVINGEYAGSYYLAETVRIGSGRVDIDELTADDNEEPEVTGGYLLAMTDGFFKEPALAANTYSTGDREKFWFEAPQFFSLDENDTLGTPEQKKYITDYLQKVSDAVYGENFKAPDGTPYTDLMDLQSTVDYWWIQEFLLSEDFYITTSNYLYKPRGDKLYWGPLWDFDYSMGLLYPTTEGFNQAYMPWLTYLREYDPEYQQMLRDRWEVLDGILNEILEEGGVFDRFVQEQEQTAKDDELLWGSCPQAHRRRCSFEQETELVRTWLTERQAWVNANIDSKLTHAYVDITFKVNGEVVKTWNQSSGLSLRQDAPEILDEDGNPIEWVEVKTGESIPWQAVYEDMTFVPVGEAGSYDPDDPDDPDNPDDPDDPDDPDKPDIPDNPDHPDNPVDPDKPDNPEISDNPGTTGGSQISDTSDNAPYTGSHAALPAMMMCIVLSLTVIAAALKKQTKKWKP